MAVGGSVLVTGYARWVGKNDPFARYRAQGLSAEATQVGIRLQDVEVHHWSEGKLVLSCDVDRVDVRRDRQNLEFFDVHEGVYRTPKAAFHFAGPKANYNATTQQFQVTRGVRLWNKDLDLKSDSVLYRLKVGKLASEGGVTGRFFGGQLAARGLTYYPETEVFETGPVLWEGKPKAAMQEVGGNQNSAWKIKGDGWKQLGDIQTVTNGEATDGEIIVKSPLLERNVKTDVITATGPVKYYGKKVNLICDRAVVYRKEKRSVLTGNVSMLIKPESEEKLEVVELQPFRPVVPEEIAASRPPAPPVRTEEQKKQDEELRNRNTARKYPVMVNAERIEYWYKRGERRAVVSGSPQARQDFPGGRWRHMWAFKAFYDGEKETLKMVSSEGKKDTHVMTSIGDDLVATWFLTSTKEKGKDEWEGEGVEGTVVSDDDDLNNRNNSNPPPTTTPPPSGGLRGPIRRVGNG